MPAVALTDHGTLGGAVKFYRAAHEEGIKPIIGLELYVATDRHSRAGVKEKNAHLTLLARNEAGYKNLVKLSTTAYLEGYYYKPRADWELLSQYHEGLIALTGCMSGKTSMLLRDGDDTAALAEVRAPRRAARPGERLRRAPGRRPARAARAAAEARAARREGRPPDGRHQRRPLPAPRGRLRARRAPLHPDPELPRRREAHDATAATSSTSSRRRRCRSASGTTPARLRGDRRDRRALRRQPRLRRLQAAHLPGARRLHRGQLPARPVRAGHRAPLRRRARRRRSSSASTSSSGSSARWGSTPTS